MQGFFSSSELQGNAPEPLIPKCAACGLYKKCKSPKMPVHGKGKRKILIVGEAPGKTEDAKGIPFCGDAGAVLRSALRKLDTDMDKDCWTYNALICRPPDNTIDNENKIIYCRPNVLKMLRELKPHVTILLGKVAVKSLIGHLWRENVEGINRWVGWRIPDRKYNTWVCPNYHPAALLYAKKDQEVMDMRFRHYLERALDLEGRPWKEVPDYNDRIEVTFDEQRAAQFIRRAIELGGPVAFDYECNMLKPEGKQAQIVCCSVCWKGKATMAFPWKGEAIKAMRELIRAPNPKIASNMKYEDRMTRRLLRTSVRNWSWDTMLAAHVLDNRKQITSIKFQAFVRLGYPPWDDHIKPFLSAKGSMESNRIKEVDMRQLMTYCGLDSLLEYEVAKLQRKEIGL